MFLADGSIAADFLASNPLTGSNDVFRQVKLPRTAGTYAGTQPDGFALIERDLTVNSFPFTDETAWAIPGQPTFEAASHHHDYHYRFWMFPSSLNLSNPTLDSPIPFRIWNTFPVPQTLLNLNVVGSSVLTFALVPGSIIPDFQFAETSFTIGAGEPTIDARADFTFTDGVASLLIRALVASTFSIIPEVPVIERWRYVTDTLKTWNGTESRLSLMAEPRLDIEMKITLVDFQDRRELYNLLYSSIRVPSLVPLFQYATPLTANTLTGGSTFFFDPNATNLRVGSYLAVINRVTREVVLGQIVTINLDGVTINSAVGTDIIADPPLWFAMPAVTCFLEDRSGITFGTQAGEFDLKAEVIEELAVLRPGATRTVQTFDGLPILEWDQLISTDERFSYRRDLIDNGIGTRYIRSRDIAVTVTRTFKFSASRLNDDLDYFRSFFKTARGSQRVFLRSTQLPDLVVGSPPGDGDSVLVLTSGDYIAKLFPFDAFKRIEVLYADGTRTQHVVTSANIDGFGVPRIFFAPALPNPIKPITRISYLQKLKASDTLLLEHFNDYTYVKFNAETVEG